MFQSNRFVNLQETIGITVYMDIIRILATIVDKKIKKNTCRC
jgi:hypothetical protein